MTTEVSAGVRLDRLGLMLAAGGAAAFALMPFLVFKVNRIVSGEPRGLFDAVPAWIAVVAVMVFLGVGAVAVVKTRPLLRLAVALCGIAMLALVIGLGATALTPVGNKIVRMSPGAGFWLLLIAFALLATDAVARLRPGPLARVLALILVLGVIGLAFASGLFDTLSVMREFQVRASSFWREAQQHVLLALGSLLAAVAVGLPLGIVCHRVDGLRAPVLQVLNMIQTIPSIALFGILMVPLGMLAAAIPFASAIGIRGIGAAPAALALFLYSLLPVVANTVVGLAQVSPPAVDAARGMGMTNRQILTDIELVLAMPVVLTGIRIVLVQNIGLATVAALIGGGGFGTFVFQGVGQTAIDLVLLGAVPTVVLAFSAAVLLDALIDVMKRAPV